MKNKIKLYFLIFVITSAALSLYFFGQTIQNKFEEFYKKDVGQLMNLDAAIIDASRLIKRMVSTNWHADAIECAFFFSFNCQGNCLAFFFCEHQEIGCDCRHEF